MLAAPRFCMLFMLGYAMRFLGDTGFGAKSAYSQFAWGTISVDETSMMSVRKMGIAISNEVWDFGNCVVRNRHGV